MSNHAASGIVASLVFSIVGVRPRRKEPLFFLVDYSSSLPYPAKRDGCAESRGRREDPCLVLVDLVHQLENAEEGLLGASVVLLVFPPRGGRPCALVLLHRPHHFSKLGWRTIDMWLNHRRYKSRNANGFHKVVNGFCILIVAQSSYGRDTPLEGLCLLSSCSSPA